MGVHEKGKMEYEGPMKEILARDQLRDHQNLFQNYKRGIQKREA